MKLKNKVALVTGGNSGIGLATATLFKQEGATVIITARSEATFQKAKSELGTQFDIVKADVSKISDIETMYQHIKSKHGGLDILFANAGIGLFRPTTEVDEAFFDSSFNTNVKGVYFTVAKALPLLRVGSSVILNASVANGKGFAGSSVYSATKAAVRSFARTWTAEVPVSQTRFNVLSPGPIDTPIFSKMGMPKEQLDAFFEGMKSTIPAKRFGTAQEMANVVLFLASTDSSYVAGIDLSADGGSGQV